MFIEYDFVTRQELKEAIDHLTKMINSNRDSSTPKKLMRSSEITKFLNCSKSTLRRMRIKGALKYSKIGDTYYYSVADL